MMDVKNYIIALFVISIMRWLIPKFGKLVNWIIIKSVNIAEKLIKGSKLGQKKKRFVLNVLKIFNIKSSQAISELVDLAVDTMNGKQDDIKSNVIDDLSNNVDETINKISNK